MPETNQDDLVVDIPDSGSQIDVEIDASPETEEPGELEESSEEHESYSKNVKKRIDKLTKKAREAERQQEAAIAYAKNVQAENNHLKDRVQNMCIRQSERIGMSMLRKVLSNGTTSAVCVI